MAHLNDSKYSWIASQVPAASGGVSGLERAWLQEVSGSTGHLNDQWNEYLTSLGYTTGALPDKMGAWLTAEGYAGSLSDKLAAFFRDFYQSFVTQSTLNGTYTRPSGSLWRNNNNELITAGLNIPVFDGRRYVSPTESSPYDLSGNLIAGLKGISIHPAIVNKCQTYGFIPDDEVQAESFSSFTTVTSPWVDNLDSTWSIDGSQGVDANLTEPLATMGLQRGMVTNVTVTLSAGSTGVIRVFTHGAVTNLVPGVNTFSLGVEGYDNFIIQARAGAIGTVSTISIKEVKYAVGTKSYHDGTSFIQNIDGMTLSGDVAGVLSIVDDGTQLDAAGWGGDESNGKVYQLDNSLGAANTFCTYTGTPGNLNKHSFVTVLRGGDGAISDDWGSATTNFTLRASYVEISIENYNPLNAGNKNTLKAVPAKSINFLLPGLYERSTTPPYPVPANSLVASTTQSATVLELPFPTGSRRAAINYTHYALETGVTRWLFGNYTDANNYVGGGINGTIAFIEKMTGGVSEITSVPLAPVTDTEYEVIAGFNPDNTMFITVDGATHTVDGSTTLAPVLASTFELGSMDGSGQVEGQFKSIQIRRG